MRAGTWNIIVVLATTLLLAYPSRAAGEEKLIAHWSFDEGSGQVMRDSSGNGNHGSIYGAEWRKVGRGGALEFDGADTVSFDGRKLGLRQGSFSIVLWLKPHSLEEIATVLGKGSDYAIRVGGGYVDKAIMFVGGEDSYRYSSSTALEPGFWTQIAFVRRDDKLNCFVDGKLSNGAANGIPVSVRDSTAIVEMGRYFRGVIDDVRIYDRALTVPEIQTNLRRTALPYGTKYRVRAAKRLAKAGLVLALAAFVLYMRLFWARDTASNPPARAAP